MKYLLFCSIAALISLCDGFGLLPWHHSESPPPPKMCRLEPRFVAKKLSARSLLSLVNITVWIWNESSCKCEYFCTTDSSGWKREAWAVRIRHCSKSCTGGGRKKKERKKTDQRAKIKDRTVLRPKISFIDLYCRCFFHLSSDFDHLHQDLLVFHISSSGKAAARCQLYTWYQTLYLLHLA